MEEAKELLRHHDITVTLYNEHFPPSSLHWLISDKTETTTVERKRDGLHVYDNPVGAMGLPGDLSSLSRFVRVCFTKTHSICQEDERSSVSQFFHILGSVEQVRGCCEVRPGEFEYTIYSICYNAFKGIAYLKGSITSMVV